MRQASSLGARFSRRWLRCCCMRLERPWIRDAHDRCGSECSKTAISLTRNVPRSFRRDRFRPQDAARRLIALATFSRLRRALPGVVLCHVRRRHLAPQADDALRDGAVLVPGNSIGQRRRPQRTPAERPGASASDHNNRADAAGRPTSSERGLRRRGRAGRRASRGRGIARALRFCATSRARRRAGVAICR